MRPDQAMNPAFGADFMWRKIRAFKDAEFTTADLHRKMPKTTMDSLRIGLRRFVDVGLVRQSGTRKVPGNNGSKAKIYICANPAAKTPTFDYPGSRGLRGERQRRLWVAIRTLREWTLEELALRASDEDLEITASCARGYAWALEKADILLCIAGRRSLGASRGMAPAVYRLNPRCNFGPEAPQVFRERGIYDPNHRRWVWTAPAAEVPA